MVMVGTLIGESLRVGAVLDDVALTSTRISRADVGDIDAGQPKTWTFIEFEVRDEDAERLADWLERSLRPSGGWYCDFRSSGETFVVFAGRTSDTPAPMRHAELPPSSTGDQPEYPRLSWTGRSRANRSA
jgi:hypothetical protein